MITRTSLKLLNEAPQPTVKQPPKPPTEKGQGPIGREAFLYMEPAEPCNEFASCAECWKHTGPDYNTCVILGPNIKVTSEMSCCLYEYGRPNAAFAGNEVAVYTTQEVGLVDRPVRCINCMMYKPDQWQTGYTGRGHCGLFEELNAKLPHLFSLDPKVAASGCCNAQQPKTNA